MIQIPTIPQINLFFVNLSLGAARPRFFFLQTRIAIPRYFSQSYGAYFKYNVHVCAMLMTSYAILKYAPYDWLKYRGMAILVCRKTNRSPARAAAARGGGRLAKPNVPSFIIDLIMRCCSVTPRPRRQSISLLYPIGQLNKEGTVIHLTIKLILRYYNVQK